MTIIMRKCKEREASIQAKHEREHVALEQHAMKLQSDLPPAPAKGVVTHFSRGIAERLREEQELVRKRRYEKAELLRQQIEMAEIDAYDELVAQRAEEVDQVRHQLTIRQEDECRRLRECIQRVSQMMPRLASMCSVNSTSKRQSNEADDEAELEELLHPLFSAVAPFLSNY